MLLGPRAAAPLSALAVALTVAACTGGTPGPAASPTPSSTTSVTPSPTATPTTTPDPVATSAPEPGTTPGATPTTPPAGDGRSVVDVVVSFAGWEAEVAAVEVSGFVPVVESDGVCRLVLTSGTGEVAVEQPATPDASTTACGWMSVGRDQLAPGTWTAVLTYASGTSVGTSAPARVEVP
jgi:hypothetical protein